MLLSLKWSFERHPGKNRLVAWPRVPSTLSREQVFQLVLSPGTLFIQGVANFREGSEFSVTSTQGETWKVEFFRENRGFCLSINELNCALFWLTIEGTPGKIETQIWLSAYDVPESQVKRFESEWKQRLQDIFPGW